MIQNTGSYSHGVLTNGQWIFVKDQPATQPQHGVIQFITRAGNTVTVTIVQLKAAKVPSARIYVNEDAIVVEYRPGRNIDHSMDRLERSILWVCSTHYITADVTRAAAGLVEEIARGTGETPRVCDLRNLRPSVLEDAAPAEQTVHTGLTDQDRYEDRFSNEAEELSDVVASGP